MCHRATSGTTEQREVTPAAPPPPPPLTITGAAFVCTASTAPYFATFSEGMHTQPVPGTQAASGWPLRAVYAIRSSAKLQVRGPHDFVCCTGCVVSGIKETETIVGALG